jgi:hypothetical protein
VGLTHAVSNPQKMAVINSPPYGLFGFDRQVETRLKRDGT